MATAPFEDVKTKGYTRLDVNLGPWLRNEFATWSADSLQIYATAVDKISDDIKNTMGAFVLVSIAFLEPSQEVVNCLPYKRITAAPPCDGILLMVCSQNYEAEFYPGSHLIEYDGDDVGRQDWGYHIKSDILAENPRQRLQMDTGGLAVCNSGLSFRILGGVALAYVLYQESKVESHRWPKIQLQHEQSMEKVIDKMRDKGFQFHVQFVEGEDSTVTVQ